MVEPCIKFGSGMKIAANAFKHKTFAANGAALIMPWKQASAKVIKVLRSGAVGRAIFRWVCFRQSPDRRKIDIRVICVWIYREITSWNVRRHGSRLDGRM